MLPVDQRCEVGVRPLARTTRKCGGSVGMRAIPNCCSSLFGYPTLTKDSQPTRQPKTKAGCAPWYTLLSQTKAQPPFCFSGNAGGVGGAWAGSLCLLWRPKTYCKFESLSVQGTPSVWLPCFGAGSGPGAGRQSENSQLGTDRGFEGFGSRCLPTAGFTSPRCCVGQR
jgi:hypothetical protein